MKYVALLILIVFTAAHVSASEYTGTIQTSITETSSLQGTVISPSTTSGGGGGGGGGGGTRTVQVTQTATSDTNGDSKVDVLDFVALMSGWGTKNTNSDINKDGIVDIQDFVTLMANWK